MSENASFPTAKYKPLLLLGVLLLSSLLSVSMAAFRIAYSDSIAYGFLIWNLFLAWAPLCAAFALWWLDGRQHRPLLLMAGLLGGWFLFFPNAPYIVTDLIHLGYRYDVPIWYDAMLIFSFAWNGLLLGLISLWIVHRLVEGWFGIWMGWLLAGLTLFASGFGVYLGRFERWNSWDIIADPVGLALNMLDPLVNPMAHQRTLAVTILFAAFLTVAYLTLSVLAGSDWREEGTREKRRLISRENQTPDLALIRAVQSQPTHPARTSPGR